jgi:VWFA-related protein
VLQQRQQPPAAPAASAPAKTDGAAASDHATTSPASAPANNASASAAAPVSANELVAPSNPAPAPKPKADTQTPAPPAAETIKVPVNEVNLIFTATDKHGHFIKDLRADDVHIVDDKKPVDKFLSFDNETDLPLRVGLLIDTSNSIRDRFKFEQQAAIEFLSDIIRPKSDQAFTLGFDTVPEVTQDFTNDTEKLAEGIRVMRPGGGTALYDALYGACRDKLMKASAGEAVRRAIILVSDGDDNQSRVTREEAIEMAQRAEVIVYTISTNTSGELLRGDKIMQMIAEQTGGRFFAPFKIEDVANAFQEIQEELRSQYAVAYKPPDFKADGRYRAIEISAREKKVHLRARRGYYAPLER